LYHQNKNYYLVLQKKGLLGEHASDEHGISHIKCPEPLQHRFMEFAASFVVPLTDSDDESFEQHEDA
jgi:hypothetical protein